MLCWLQQALRAFDNPVIDAAVLLGNALGLPVLVYHGVREDYPFASARLHAFILGASRDLERNCVRRGLTCVQFVDRPAKRAKGLVYRLATEASAVVLEDQPAFVSQWQSERFASRAEVAVFAVNAACVVPPGALEQGIGTTSAFRRRHEKVRADWFDTEDVQAEVLPFTGDLPFEPDGLGTMDDEQLIAVRSQCAIDHDLRSVALFPATRAEVALRLKRLQLEVLPAYAGARGNAARPEGASTLSPYLHFGVVGPREVVAAVRMTDISEKAKAKFLDELLTWREWFHYKARSLRVPESYERVPA